jgi:hypothetical protein
MLFAVIPDVEKMTTSAFLPPQRIITVKYKKFSGSDTPGPNDPGITQEVRIKI